MRMHEAALELAKFIDTSEQVNANGTPFHVGLQAHLEGTRAALLRKFREARLAAELPHIVTAPNGAAYPCTCSVGEDHELSHVLVVWTIYEKPADYPTVPFVVRAWHVSGGQQTDAGALAFADTLDQARSMLPAGLHRFPPSDGYDDPVVVESWL